MARDAAVLPKTPESRVTMFDPAPARRVTAPPAPRFSRLALYTSSPPLPSIAVWVPLPSVALTVKLSSPAFDPRSQTPVPSGPTNRPSVVKRIGDGVAPAIVLKVTPLMLVWPTAYCAPNRLP
jgi:hypothetical protein